MQDEKKTGVRWWAVILAILVISIGFWSTSRPVPSPTPQVVEPPSPTPVRLGPTPPGPARMTPEKTPSSTLDLQRSMANVENYIRSGNWPEATVELKRMDIIWSDLRVRVQEATPMEAVREYDTALQKLRTDVQAQDKTAALADMEQLNETFSKLKVPSAKMGTGETPQGNLPG